MAQELGRAIGEKKDSTWPISKKKRGVLRKRGGKGGEHPGYKTGEINQCEVGHASSKKEEEEGNCSRNQSLIFWLSSEKGGLSTLPGYNLKKKSGDRK